MGDLPLLVVIDSNVFDDLADDDDTFALVDAAVGAGLLVLVVTRHQYLELADVPDKVKLARLVRLETDTTPAVAVWDLTTWDGPDVWASDQNAATYDDAGGASGHLVDAQTLVAAQRLGVPLVTADKGLRRKAKRNGVTSMSSADLLALLRP